MANGLRIELSESTLTASAGSAVTIRATIYNASMIVDEYAMRVEGIDPSWVTIPAMTARIFPESSETISVSFLPPRNASVAAGDYPFVIVATSSDNPALSASANGVLSVGPFVDFSFENAGPRQSSGETEGTFEFKVTNLGNAQLSLSLEASDENNSLTYEFGSPVVEVPPGQPQTVKLTVRPQTVRLDSGATFAVAVTAAIVAVNPPMPIPQDGARKQVFVTYQQVPGTQDPPRLEPEIVELAGQQAETSVILTNKSSLPVTVRLEASEGAKALDFEFVGGPEQVIPANGTLPVTMRITCLDRTKLAPAPAPTQYTVTVTPINPSGEPRQTFGQVTTPGPADFRLRLEPGQVESTGPETVRLIIENVSPRQATFTIAAASQDTALTVAASQAEVEITGGGQIAVPVELTPIPENMGQSPTGTARPCAFTLRVAPVDAPARTNEIHGQYLFAPAAITMRLVRKEIEAAGETTFDLHLENGGRGEVAVAMAASDRAGACTYTFDLPRLRIAARGTALVRLTVTPPEEHAPDARWQFEVTARPTNPPGNTVREEGVLIYRAPTVGLALNPPERKGRRPRTYSIMLTNSIEEPMTVKLSVVDRSGGLGLNLKQESVQLPPAGRGAAKVPLKVTPWKRQKGSGAQALSFGVNAVPIQPPGDATTLEGRFVALPPRSKWFWILLALIALIALLFSPLYEQAFYWAGWHEDWIDPRTGEEWNAEHHFHTDISCTVETVIREQDPTAIQPECFEQGPPPTEAPAQSLRAPSSAVTQVRGSPPLLSS